MPRLEIVSTGLIASADDGSIAGATGAYAIAIVVGGSAYVLGFLALSTFTSKALAIGLGYVLLWEGILADLLEGTRVFSIRQATLGLAAELQGTTDPETPSGSAPFVILAAVILGSLVLASWRLSRYQFRGGD